MQTGWMNESPLIVSPAAARRLKLLMGHGLEASPRLQDALPAALANASSADAAVPDTFHAHVLPWPATVGADNDLGDLQRDVLAEVAVAPAALQKLELPAGALVRVSNPDRPEVWPHLARVWPSPDLEKNAALSPALAHNLGLALHLLPFLQADAAASEKGSAAGHAWNCSRVVIRPFEEAAAAREEGEGAVGLGATLPQPAPLEPAKVAVAHEIHVSVVREPATGWRPPSDGPERAESSSSHGDSAVEAIQRYFADGLRSVCEGDVLAAPIKGTSQTAEVLRHLGLVSMHEEEEEGEKEGAFSDTSEERGSSPWSPSRLVHFRVARVLPENVAVQVVDVAFTMVTLVGTCASPFPVGLPGYLSPAPPPTSLLGWHAGAAALHHGWCLPFVGELLPTWRRLAHLVAPLLHPASRFVPLRLAVLLHGPAGAGKRTAVTAAAAALGCHVTRISCREIGHPDPMQPEGKAGEALRVAFDAAARYRPAFLVLDELEALIPVGEPQVEAAAARLGAVLAEGVASPFGFFGSTESSPQDHKSLFPAPLIVVACAPVADDVPPPLRRCFTHEIEVEAPDAAARERLLRSFMAGAAGRGSLSFEGDQWAGMARHTAGLLPRNLKSFAADACAAASLAVLPPATVLEGAAEDEVVELLGGDGALPSLGPCHVSAALDAARGRMAIDIGAPKIPNVEWGDVGGLDDVKAAILDTVELPLKHPELFAGGLRRRSGVLLYGPPGTGKTLLAKAVATECAVNFMSVKGPELINMYVGESERQVREVFARARRARPCVVFFDELDSLAPARGRGSDSGGVMDRVVSQLLAEIDSAQGGSGTDDVFIVGATNRPDLLDPALLRPGRLDKLLYVGVASDAASQLAVITALTRRFDMHESVDLAGLARALGSTALTGADLYALCSDAWMSALKRRMAAAPTTEGPTVVVQQADFEGALQSLKPSLQEQDIARYEAIRDQYQGRKK